MAEVDGDTKIQKVFSGRNDTLVTIGPRDRQSIRIGRQLASGTTWQGLK